MTLGATWRVVLLLVAAILFLVSAFWQYVTPQPRVNLMAFGLAALAAALLQP